MCQGITWPEVSIARDPPQERRATGVELSALGDVLRGDRNPTLQRKGDFRQRLSVTQGSGISMAVEEGQAFSWERTFTRHDVEDFARLSGDAGIHHVTPDSAGRIMVHGLLTATVPTKIGGDMNYIARQMTFEFLRPVYVGDTIRVDGTITRVSPSGRQLQVAVAFECRNQHGKTVLTGTSHGIIRDARPSTVESPT